MSGEHSLLVGPQGIDGTGMRGRVILQKDRRTLTFIIAQVGTMLGIAGKRRKLGREMARDLGWIG